MAEVTNEELVAKAREIVTAFVSPRRRGSRFDLNVGEAVAIIAALVLRIEELEARTSDSEHETEETHDPA